MLKDEQVHKEEPELETLQVYDTIANKLIDKYGQQWMHQDEYKSVIIENLVKSDLLYKPDRNASKSTFRFGRWKFVKRKLFDLRKRRAKNASFSNLNIEDSMIVDENLYDYEYHEDAAKTVQEMIDCKELTPAEKKYMRLVFQEGLTQSEAARKLNVDRRAVGFCINKALRKLRGIYVHNAV